VADEFEYEFDPAYSGKKFRLFSPQPKKAEERKQGLLAR